MFESDDWNFDEDFLQDADNKAVQFFSQVEYNETELPVKKRKMETYSCSSVTNVEMQKITGDTPKLFKTNAESLSKKHVLKVLEKNYLEKIDSCNVPNHCKESLHSSKNISQDIYNTTSLSNCVTQNNTIRRNLVLDILKSKDISNKNIEKVEKLIVDNKETPISCANLTNDCNKSKELFNNVESSLNDLSQEMMNKQSKNKFDKIHNYNSRDLLIKKQNELQELSLSKFANSYFNTHTKKVIINDEQNSRRQLLIQNLKPCISSTSEFDKMAKNSSFAHKTEIQASKKTTMIRKFPGPAGLLPDIMDNTDLPISYLKSLDETVRLQHNNDSNLNDYCSQNTKNLFIEGAWQLMLNDLPTEFLKGYEIATIKQIANANHYQCTKVPFLAGIIEHIDHNHENPPIILKDITDTIQGIMHRDIPLKYPGTLEPNIVILLQDVGLLKISGTILVNKYHILISPSSLLGIYSSKGKIIHTSQMEFILQNKLNNKSNKIQHNVIETDNKIRRMEKNISNNKLIKDIEKISMPLNKNKDSTSFEIFSHFDTSDSDVDELAFSLQEITNSQNQKQFLKSKLSDKLHESKSLKELTLINKKYSEINSIDYQKNSLDCLKQYLPNSDVKKLAPISNEKVSNTECSNVSLKNEDIDNITKSKIENKENNKNNKSFSSETSNINEECNDNLNINFKAKNKDLHSKKNIMQQHSVPIRSKLLAFKSNDILTQIEVVDSSVESLNVEPNVLKDNTDLFINKESSFKKMNWIKNAINENENEDDPYDEVLSQLDIDAIFSNYK